jgi:hypothetical protein
MHKTVFIDPFFFCMNELLEDGIFDPPHGSWQLNRDSNETICTDFDF